MHSGPRLRPAVFTARQQLAEGREKLRAQHERGSPGIQVCTLLTDLLDHILTGLYRAALDATSYDLEKSLSLVALGGYGRRDVAPFSDVDLMLLHPKSVEQRVVPFVQILTQDICDAGLQLGFSLRTVPQACSLAMQDATVFTSLVEARLLGGSDSLFSSFWRAFRRKTTQRSRMLIERIEASRREERHQYGETVYLLHPNIKRSRGGLRDLHLVRWIAFARYGECAPENLALSGWLSKGDQNALRKAHEFLLRLRNELHFHAGRGQDVLDRDEQLRIAALFGYGGDAQLLPVERFLRDYIEHTNDVRFIGAHFLESAKDRTTAMSLIRPVFSHRVDGDFRVDPVHIRATPQGLVKLRNDLATVLRLMDLANRYGNRIEHKTWVAIRESMTQQADLPLSPQAVERFLSLISQPGRLGSLLRRLHELRVLERIIPPMAHARGLMQFNDYHKYTVDEHSIRAVACASDFVRDSGPIGVAYRGIKDKGTLHLALLLHDLGKGYVEEHCQVGSRLAAETAAHLGLGARETEKLVFLVQKHLFMSHLCQRRDINDDAVVVQFAVEVGSPELLQMLYVLTCADLAAVGPGVLNSWKMDLLERLYRRARQHLAGDTPGTASTTWIQERREKLLELTRDRPDGEWWEEQIGSLPETYLVGAEAEEVVDELARVQYLPRNQAVAWGKYSAERSVVQYTVGTHEEITPGIFHKLTGALSSQGMQILSAEIHTLAGDLVLDRFYVQDMDFSGEPPGERLEEVGQALVASLQAKASQPPVFRRLWAEESKAFNPAAPRLPTQVRIDNSTSDRFTILDIFAHDRMGLLYTISRTVFELGMSVHAAKIGTYLDQVVDVFYVTDQRGGKIHDDRRLAEIRQRLMEEIEAFSVAGRSVRAGRSN